MITSTPHPGGRPSLRELAEANRLPDHQVMDVATLSWIARSRPAGPGVRATMPHRPLLLVPDDSWFARTETAGSTHGVRHGARVAVLVQLLAHSRGLTPARTRALAVAAACHDCQRHTDRDDPGHGWRAADWLAGNNEMVAAVLGAKPTTEAITAVALHDTAHEAFTGDQANAYHRHPEAVDLLKAADALDRYRLPLARWWPDLDRLRLAVSAWLPAAAHDLVVHSEQAHLAGATHTQALDHALRATFQE
ncbi:hypothetical protein [Kitasatospora sp. NPDC047058]|uniref:HD domain-containing protein n=1 Tax=Kitasatospora sp. NPDC047058 TaxID=3155620 RepID=UPI0033C9B826